MEHRLRHRTASGGSLVNLWDIDEDDKLLCSIQVASAPLVHVVLVVRSVNRRRREAGQFACWSLTSSGECWRVEHGVYDARPSAEDMDERRAALAAMRANPCEETARAYLAALEPEPAKLPPMSLLLTNAPANVSRRLSTITAP